MYKRYSKDSLDKNIDVYIHDPNICLDIGMIGDADKFFMFKQNVPSDVWHVKHNLDKYPSVTVVDSAENVVVGEVTYVDNNNLIIHFTSAFSGKAYMN